MSMKFIHAADVHIDSPLRGLEAYEGAPVQQLRRATREAFERLITLAIDERVDFVIVAGDLFDGPWLDMHTGLWTAGQFRRLADENIAVYLLRGNHDAASKVRQAVRWPENVQSFSTERPETFLDESSGAAVHGLSFAQREVSQDIAAGYPDPVPRRFNIGVLHTSLTGSAEHDPYAPTTPEVLVGKGYDYWALGHVHARSEPPIREEPYIAFAGNTQGRHIRETGPKGCLLVTVDDAGQIDVQFHATDVLRWHRLEVVLGADDDLPELYDLVRQRLLDCYRAADGRFCAVRLRVRGACAAQRSLLAAAAREEAIAEIRNLANELDGQVWVEKIQLDVAPPVDLDALRRSSDLVGDLLRQIDQLAEDPPGLLELAGELRVLANREALAFQEAGLDPLDPLRLQPWLREAANLLVARLLETPS